MLQYFKQLGFTILTNDYFNRWETLRMAADLNIHVYSEGELSEDDFKIFYANTMGSKWFDEDWFNGITQVTEGVLTAREEKTDAAREKIYKTKSVWVGQVSWLKAALMEDGKRYIPSLVQQVSDLVSEDLPRIDDNLIILIGNAFDTCTNETGYDVAKKEEVLAFLEANKGKRAFTISW